MWSQFAATPRKLSPLSCCIIWSAIFPYVTLLCDQDRHGVYARRHLLNYSKAPLSLHVSFVVVSGGIRGPLTFTSFAREWTQVGLALVSVNGVEVRREADEEGDGEKRWVFFSAAKCCVCVCEMTCLPFTFCLTVWCCCECWRRTCEEPDSGQQNGTPAWVFTLPPLQSLSLHLAGLQLWTHIFSVRVGAGWRWWWWGGGKQTHQKPQGTECIAVFDVVTCCCQIFTWRQRTEGFPSSPQSFCSLHWSTNLYGLLLVIFKFLLFVSHNSASHELVMRITPRTTSNCCSGSWRGSKQTNKISKKTTKKRFFLDVLTC